MLENATTIRSIAVSGTPEVSIEELVRQHAHFVFRVAYSVLRNHHDAEDAAQEAFLRATRHRQETANVLDMRAWLARTVWRIAVDRRRSATHEDDADPTPLLEQLRCPAASAEQEAIDTQMLRLTEGMMATLPAELRDVITLSTVQELTSSEVGSILALPEGTVRTRLARARSLLRQKLAELLKGGAR